MTPPLQPAIRANVIDALINLMFGGMEPLLQEATSMEVASAVFTLCARVINYSTSVADLQAREHNIESARTAIGQLYALLPPYAKDMVN